MLSGAFFLSLLFLVLFFFFFFKKILHASVTVWAY